MLPPAPKPQNALAIMKLSILFAAAHHSVARPKTDRDPRNKGFLPMASESRPRRGWKAVDVNKKDVDSHDAELAAPKYDVITGWDEAMMVPSKHAMNWTTRICEKMCQKREGEVPFRKRGGSESLRTELAMERCPDDGTRERRSGDCSDGANVIACS
jgi:hypothetical protein